MLLQAKYQCLFSNFQNIVSKNGRSQLKYHKATIDRTCAKPPGVQPQFQKMSTKQLNAMMSLSNLNVKCSTKTRFPMFNLANVF